MLLILLSYFLFNYFYMSLLVSILMIYFTLDLIYKKEPIIQSANQIIKRDVKLSIIIPVFNEEENLINFMSSLFKNNLDNVDLIFVNDSSTDNSLIILEEYKKIHKFKIINIFKQKYVCDVLNFGIKHVSSNTSFVGVLNSDCTLSEDCIDLVKNRLMNYNIESLNLNNSYYNNDNLVSYFASCEKDFKNYLFTFKESSLNNGYFIKKELIDSWESITEDLNMNLKLKAKEIITYHDPNIIIYDKLPNNFNKLMNQKFRWIYGDITNRIKFNTLNLFDIIVNIYFFTPLFSLITVVCNFKVSYILNFQCLVILCESIILFKAKGFNFNFLIDSFIFGILQFTFQIYFYLRLLKLIILNEEIKW